MTGEGETPSPICPHPDGRLRRPRGQQPRPPYGRRSLPATKSLASCEAAPLSAGFAALAGVYGVVSSTGVLITVSCAGAVPRLWRRYSTMTGAAEMRTMTAMMARRYLSIPLIWPSP